MKVNGFGIPVSLLTGIQHSEFSLNGEKADLVQIWFLPPKKGLAPEYKSFTLQEGTLTTVLGGNDDTTFDNAMTCQIGLLAKGDVMTCDTSFVAFLSGGNAMANGRRIKAGDLIEGEVLHLSTEKGCDLVLIQFTKTLKSEGQQS